MSRSVAIVGAGQIGFAAATAFAEAGWDVRVLARSQPEWHFEGVRFEPYVIGVSDAPIADAIIDTIALDDEDVRRYDPCTFGRLVVVSSASVYCDAEGWTLDEAAQNGFPNFVHAITESQATVTPGPETYSTRKMRMENAARDCFRERATILRPCAIHGPWSRHPREWWFVKRLLDGRRNIPLAHRGMAQFQTTAARLIGKAALSAVVKSMAGTFNLADDNSPTVHCIDLAIAEALGQKPNFVLFDCDSTGAVGRTPWSIPAPMVVSGSKANETFDLTRLPYSFAVNRVVDWLADRNPPDWRQAFPQLAAYPWDLFDYEAEDRFLNSG